MKSFILYLFRWQLSTLILYPVVLGLGSALWAIVSANLIGGCVFYWIDQWIFKSKEIA